MKPCRICSCFPEENQFCRALHPTGRACFRVKGQDAWCSCCASWSKETRAKMPSNVPIEALACLHRAERSEAAAAKRGTGENARHALRVHASRMRRKANQFMITAGIASAPAPQPVKDRNLPLSTANL